MPTELEDLVEFLHHGNTQIRQIAVENLMSYSTEQRSIFKTGQLTPVRDLKLLVKDYAPIAKGALTILINISDDEEILQNLGKDDAFLESLLSRITNAEQPNANEIAMLLANLAKSPNVKRILNVTRRVPKTLSSSSNAMDQLMDCFVKGAEGRYNKSADFDYLAYFFADMAQHPEGRAFFMTHQQHEGNLPPITKLTVFTKHKSVVRRRGVASTIKNVAFDVPSRQSLLSSSNGGIDILPYLLLPLMGPEDYSEEDTEGMLEDLQLLPPDKEREKDPGIVKTHLESLLLLTTTREGRDVMRQVKVYPIIRELHMHAFDEEVREGCDRLVQVIVRDEEGEGKGEGQESLPPEDEEDEQIIEV